MAEKVLFYFLLSLLIAVPAYLVMHDREKGAAVLVAAIAAAILLTRLNDISAFDLFSLKVKLERQSHQVDVTLVQLQKLAVASAEANLTQLAMSGQMLSGLNTDYKFKVHDQIVKSLEDIKVPDDEISKAQLTWKSVYCRLLLDRIGSAIFDQTKEQNLGDEIDALPSDDEIGVPTPNTVQGWVASKGVKSEPVKKLLKEYDTLFSTGTMNEPNQIPFNAALRIKNKN